MAWYTISVFSYVAEYKFDKKFHQNASNVSTGVQVFCRPVREKDTNRKNDNRHETAVSESRALYTSMLIWCHSSDYVF